MSDFAREAFTLLGLAIIIIGLRTAARWYMVGPRNFQADDYLMLLACVVYGLETAAAYIVGAWFDGLANNSMTDEQRASISPHSKEYHLRVGGSKVQVTGWSLYTLLLWLLKTCLAIFYSRLTMGLFNMRIRIHLAYVLIGSTYIATVCSILFGCHPMHKNWQIYPDPGNVCQPAVSKIDIYVTVILNVSTDIYLISIPTPAGPNGAEAAGSWACRETFVAVVIGNVPMIYPLLRRLVRRQGLFSISNGDSYELSEGFTASSSSKRKKKFRHPLSLPTEIQWNTASDEQMILPSSHQPLPTYKGDVGDWDTSSHPSNSGSIKVVQGTIVHSAERDR
ncbi:hypothetical protein UA08_09199 [Talaromyces atroroseus]|uniref:Rhodopsin domain-containing protein n=1 Tax=Talaromyces atroroseus TaxID=1441469 RepID=A0A1Q5Q6S7_TALAT|nr:hypothetical protein UA08_09199 [Talaromyces atroroseus]OKL55473.1 hypothetical protein UA08_09199 [Talaromyces atroroseus]